MGNVSFRESAQANERVENARRNGVNAPNFVKPIYYGEF